jgi:hypothetical protein
MPWSSHDEEQIEKLCNNGTSPRKFVDVVMNDNNTGARGAVPKGKVNSG